MDVSRSGSQPRGSWLRDSLSWIGRNLDGAIASLVAIVLAVLEVVSTLPDGVVNGAMLLVLGTLAVVLLRDREHVARIREMEPELAAVRRQVTELDGQLAAVRQGLAGQLADLGRDLDRAMADAAMLRVLSGPEVTAAHALARRDTDKWLFRGGTGTFMRAVTLRECIASARLRRVRLRVRMEIIDPTNEALCRRYARFRQSAADAKPDWTPERTRREGYATILAGCWYRQRHELLDLEVGLSPVMPTLRWDMSTAILIITQENPQGPALAVDSGKLLYSYLETELDKSFEQARRVPLERGAALPLRAEPSVAEVRAVFAAMDLPLPKTFTDSDVADIVTRALHAENPYAP